MKLSRIWPVIGLGAIALAWLALSLSGVGRPGETHVVVLQEPSHLREVASNGESSAPGNVLVFDAPFAAADGSLTGIVSGSMLIVPGSGAATSESGVVVHRLTDLVFNFDEKGTIVVAGGVISPPGFSGDPAAGQPLVRPIVTGTGAFVGAQGQLASTLAEDGSYTHEFTIRK